MHQIYYENCIVCKSRFQPYELKNSVAMKCPKANDWRRVIDNKLPHAESTKKADEIIEILKSIGITSNGYHSNFYDGKSDNYVIRMSVLENALEKLMRYEPIDGALVHDCEIVCTECARRMRMEAYDGDNQVPEIKCPICKTVLVPWSE